MKQLFIIVLLISFHAGAQSTQEKLIGSIKNFHLSLVSGNTSSLNQQTDKALSYGHSNGWVETKNEMIQHLESGYIKYHSYKEDSLMIDMNDDMANARFVADINLTMNNYTVTLHLKVLEVWVKKGKRWLLFARQAVR